MEKTPQVSIIMPAYNAEEYIGEAIGSVVMQNVADWELIVIDDGSSDKTGEVVRAFNDPRIRYFRQENRGVSAARNLGIEKAQGEYLTFLDADDLLPSKSLEKRIEYMKMYPDIDVVDGVIHIMDESLSKKIREYRPDYLGPLLPRLAALDDQVFFNVCYFFRKSSLGKVRFNEEMSHAEDLLFFLQIADSSAARYGALSDLVYIYRQRKDSSMSNLSGLERGYRQLLASAGKMSGLNHEQIKTMRWKITRIMFLSWLGQGNVSRAILSLWRLGVSTSLE